MAGDERHRCRWVVVLRALGLGDLLVAVPALRLLRRALPEHRILLATPTGLAPVVRRVDAVDEHLPCATPADLPGACEPAGTSGPAGASDPPGGRRAPSATGVDVAVNLHGRGPESHAALDRLTPHRRIGHAAPGWDGPAWTDDPDRSERRRWCDLLAAAALVSPAEAAAGADDLRLDRLGTRLPGRGIDDVPERSPRPVTGPPVAVVHPGAAFGSKRWPAARFAAVAAGLAARGFRVVVTGSGGERPLTAAVADDAGLGPGDDRGGRTDLLALLDLVADAALVVAGDTGVGHVATAFGTPSVTLFGPVGPEQWGPPPGGRHITLTDPSRRRGARFADDPDPALLAVTPEEVLAACRLVSPG